MAYSSYKVLTLSAGQCGSQDSGDWPLGIILDNVVQNADADLRTVGNGGYVQNVNGYDIRPFTDATLSTPIPFELVFYDGSAGKLEMWVKIAALSHTTSTTIVLAFGNPLISTNASDPTGTFANSFVSIWHFQNSGSLGTDALGHHTLTPVGSPTTAADGVGGQSNGVALNGTSQRLDETTAFAAPAAISLSCWMKCTDFNAYVALFSHFYSGAQSQQFAVSNTGTLYWQVRGSSGSDNTTTGSTAMSLSTWYFVTATYSTTDRGKVYVNGGGTPDGTNATDVGTVTTASVRLNVGAINDTSNLFKGTLDEMRFSSAVRSASWITADYNAQKAGSTFLAWGTRQVAPGTYVLTAASGTTAATGTAVTLRVAHVLIATTGSVAISGATVMPRVGRVVVADTGSAAMTGMAATGRVGHVVITASGSVATTGTVAGLRADRRLTLAPGPLVLSGTTAAVRVGRDLIGASGSYGVGGTGVSLRYSGAVSTYTLVAASGSYASTGTAGAFHFGRVLAAVVGACTVTGRATALATTRTLTAGDGTVSTTGTSAGLVRRARLTATMATAYAVTGTESTSTSARRLIGLAGAYAVTGTSAALYRRIVDHELVTTSLSIGRLTMTTLEIGRLVAMTAER